MEEKELEAFKVIRYMINKVKKDIAKQMIFALQNNNEGAINHLYKERETINNSFKFYKKK